MLNLDAHRWPVWKLQSRIPLSLYPSVIAEHGAEPCHFIVRKGRILWVPKGKWRMIRD
jgi:hypothetical protein